MKGIIMAGGEGTRLRPLTCDCPKPMIRLMDKPLMQYAIELLKRHGIVDIAVTLGYQPDAIAEYFGDGGDFGIRLQYFVERVPLGTAGGVGQARAFLDEPFVVLSGDGLTDLDIRRAAEFHRQRGALATLVLKHTDSPMDYGVVDVDAEGRVRSFHEKPDWSEVVSDTINTGIYIIEPSLLERIPCDRPCDFGHELFPKLVREGLGVYGYVTDDYWCDVGDVRAYLSAHADAMEGRIRLAGLSDLKGRALQRPGAVVDRAAVLEGPCFIDVGAHISAGAYVGPYSVVGRDCEIGERASVKRGILWPGAKLLPHAQLRGGVMACDARMDEGAQAYEESVLGTGAEAEAHSVLLPGVKLWPGKHTSEGERLDANRVWGGEKAEGFKIGTLPADTPAEAARAAQAFVAALKPREMVLGSAGTPLAIALAHAAMSGCLAQGVDVIDIGRCTLPLLRHALLYHRADAALFLDDDGITPLNALGSPLPHRDRRSVEQYNARQDYPRPVLDAAPRALRSESAGAAYIADAAGLFTADPAKAMPIALYSENAQVVDLAVCAFERAGLSFRVAENETDILPAPGELGITLNASGESCAFCDEYGGLTDAQHQLMIAWVALRSGETALMLPDSATRGIDDLAGRYEAQVERIPGERALWQNALALRQPFQFELQCDGLMLALRALSLLTELGVNLADWRRDMPEVHRRSRIVSIPAKQGGRVLHDFAEIAPDAELRGGVRLERDGGWAWVGADGRNAQLRVVAEGASAEFADELCGFCMAEIARIAGSAPKNV